MFSLNNRIKELKNDLDSTRKWVSSRSFFNSLIQVFRLVNTDVSEVIANSGISINNMDILALIIRDMVRVWRINIFAL